MIIILIITLLLICTPFLWWYSLLRKYKLLDKIPGPKPLPLLGNAIETGNTPQELLGNIFRWAKEYGDVYKFYIVNEVRVLISKAELMESILSSNIHITKSHTYDHLEPWLGNGLLMSTGKKWKIRRRMITPTFHFKILDQFLGIFDTCGNILIDKLSSEVGKDSVDIYPFINLYSLDVICETSMGVKVAAQEGHNTEYVEAVRGYLDIFIVRTFSPLYKFDPLFKLSPMYTTYKKCLKTLHAFSNNIIIRRRAEKSEQNLDSTVVSDDGTKRKVALLDMLLESENYNVLSNEDIREEIDTFMFEGHDTTTSAIVFTLLALADNPEVQKKVYEEILSLTGEKNSYLTMQILQDAKYLEMVIKEAQRMYPTVPIVERQLETHYSIGGYDFPQGTILTIFIYAIHHNEKYYPKPEIFDPERFSLENQSQRHNYAFIPFSAGPRNCVGQKFAMLEMKATIIKIVKKFKILPVPGYKPELGMAAVLKSYNGVRVRLQTRH
jgi:cytochrome P450 family 4